MIKNNLFVQAIGKFLRPGGTVHLKTDSRYLLEYTKAVFKVNGLGVFCCDADVYHSEAALPKEVREVQTFYETMFLQMGLPITYLSFGIDHQGPYTFPGAAFDHDHWLQAEGPRRTFSHQPTRQG